MKSYVIFNTLFKIFKKFSFILNLHFSCFFPKFRKIFRTKKMGIFSPKNRNQINIASQIFEKKLKNFPTFLHKFFEKSAFLTKTEIKRAQIICVGFFCRKITRTFAKWHKNCEKIIFLRNATHGQKINSKFL